MARTIQIYKSYAFPDKDPIIDRFFTVVKDVQERDPRFTLLELSYKSGVSVSTFKNWRDGKTKRPQNATVTAGLRAMGYDLAVVAPDGTVTGLTRHFLPGAGSNVVMLRARR